jgi:hypothetical protein
MTKKIDKFICSSLPPIFFNTVDESTQREQRLSRHTKNRDIIKTTEKENKRKDREKKKKLVTQ